MRFADSMKKWKRTQLPQLVAEFEDALTEPECERLQAALEDAHLQGVEYGVAWAWQIYNESGARRHSKEAAMQLEQAKAGKDRYGRADKDGRESRQVQDLPD